MPSQRSAPNLYRCVLTPLKKTKRLPRLPIAETSFESPLAGSETAEQQAGFVPNMASQHSAPNL